MSTRALALLLAALALLAHACTHGPAQAPATVASPAREASTPQPVLPPPADGFDFPVGPPDAKGYYNAQGFTRNTHLGDDWNGKGGGNTDLGDPVHVIGDGIVKMAQDEGPGWGNVVRVLHNAGTAAQPDLVESLYAHLDKMLVAAGDTLRRGQQIGTIGNADGAYWAHLHLEIRTDTSLGLGGGYSSDTTGYTDPTRFIRGHRPQRR